MPEPSIDDPKVTFLLKALDKQIASFDGKRHMNKRRAFWLKIAGTSFAATTTVLIGFQGLSEYATLVAKNSALMLSALVTLLSTWDAFFDHRQLWIKYTAVSCRLKGLKADLEYIVAARTSKIDQTQINEIYEKYKNTLDDVNESWQRLRKVIPEHSAPSSP